MKSRNEEKGAEGERRENGWRGKRPYKEERLGGSKLRGRASHLRGARESTENGGPEGGSL